jgi:predicted acetyltransferase
MRPRCSLQVDLLFALSTQALARLWRYCAEVDWVTTVKAEARPEDELLPWLLVDGRHARLLSREDMVWLRPLDVPGLLSARRLGGDGRIVMEVKDPDGYAAGRFELEGSVEGSACRPAGATPAVTLSPGALGTLALGGGSAATLQAAGWIEEHEPGGVAMLDRLLGWPQPPWTPIWF